MFELLVKALDEQMSKTLLRSGPWRSAHLIG